MKYQINSTGAVILADASFMEQYHSGDYTLVAEVEQPTAPRIITKLAYMNRFTNAELVAIYTAAKSSIQLEIWIDKLKLASEVDLNNEEVKAGLMALETMTLIGKGRADEILA